MSFRNHSDRERRSYVLFVLLVLPLLTAFAYASLRSVSGPFWLTENLDPSYAYLLNSVNMANLRRPYNMEPHPGVTVQWIGGVMLRLSNGSAKEHDLATRVISDPETNLKRLNGVLVAIYCLCIAAAGYMVFRGTGSLLLALLIQGSVFYSANAIEGTLGFRPEGIFLPLTLFFSVLALLATRVDIEKHAWKFSLAFGVIFGLGMASKLNFMGLVMVPMILLPGWKWRSIFAATAGTVFLVVIVPILTPYHLGRMSGFIFNTLTHTGRYGAGAAGIVDKGKFLHSARELFFNDLFFFAIVIVSLIVLMLRSRLRLDARSSRVLMAVVAAQLVQFLIVAKHPHSRYLIPALGLVGVNICILIQLVFGARGRNVSPSSRVTAGIAILFLVPFGIWEFVGLRTRLDQARVKQLEAYSVRNQRFAGFPAVGFYTASSPDYALKHGTEWSGNLYADILAKIYPDSRFYDPWLRRFYSFRGPLDVKDISADGHAFIMYGCSLIDKDFTQFLPPNAFPQDLVMQPVFRGDTDEPGAFDGETIYMVNRK